MLFKDDGGGSHYTKEAAWSASRSMSMGSFLSAVGKWIVLIPIIGAVAVVGLMVLAGLRGFIILAQTLWLFGVAGIIGLAAGVFVFIKARFLSGKLILFLLRLLLLLVVSVIVAAPFVYASYKLYYAKSDLFFKSVYFADYIQELPDGTLPVVHEKRFQKGDILAELSLEERVTVNGITMDYNEYNITTSGGITGWIPADSFPEDGEEMLAVTISSDGYDSQEIHSDRLAHRFLQRYFNETASDIQFFGKTLTGYIYDVKQSTLDSMRSTNAETPIMYITAKEYKAGGEMQDSGIKARVSGVLYAPDVTLVYVTKTHKINANPNRADVIGMNNVSGWLNSLVVTDLDTGEQWKVLPYEYPPAEDAVILGDGNAAVGTAAWSEQESRSSMIFFFPPFKSRHFSLTHEISALPDRENVETGYGGILGLIAKHTVSSSIKETLIDWNFPEVRVR